MSILQSEETGTAKALTDEVFKQYTERAQKWVDPILRSRTGFGAFRHFRGIFNDTFGLVRESSFIRVGRRHRHYYEYKGDGWDFAAFVTFAIADPAAEHGVLVDGPRSAISVLRSDHMPSRVMVITIGEGVTIVDWADLLHEYLPRSE